MLSVNNDYKVYNIIPDTNNIIYTLVENITNDELFHKHINKLNDSAIVVNMQKADTIKQTINNIKVFNNKVMPLFLAKDIGILLGISQINYLIKSFEDEEVVTGYITNNKTKKVIFLTRHGIYRCFYASKSPLAKLFRKFIGNLVDHMITHESMLLQKISDIFKVDNPDLIENGINDLNNRLTDYITKYDESQTANKLLELQYTEESNKRRDAENEIVEIDILNSYKSMHIEQLKQEKLKYTNKIKNIQSSEIYYDDSSDLLELRMLKEKFMKPVYIYILHPIYLNKLLLAKKKCLENKLLQNGKDNYTDKEKNNLDDTIENINSIIDETIIYKNNFNNIVEDNKIDPDEILYLSISLIKKVEKVDKILHVNTQWVLNKKHYNNSISALHTCIVLNKLMLYKTSIDEIIYILREEFIIL